MAVLRHRIVSGEKGSMNGTRLAFSKRLAVPQHAVVARRRLGGEADGLEPANELANVLSHPRTSNHNSCMRRLV